MGIRKYAAKVSWHIFAVLWNGDAKELADLPNFNRLLEHIQSIDDRGLLSAEFNDSSLIIAPGTGYIFFDPRKEEFGYMRKSEFEDYYETVIEVMEWKG